VTPSMMPQRRALRISSGFALSRKNFISNNRRLQTV
jgi:hypothetical protein